MKDNKHLAINKNLSTLKGMVVKPYVLDGMGLGQPYRVATASYQKISFWISVESSAKMVVRFFDSAEGLPLDVCDKGDNSLEVDYDPEKTLGENIDNAYYAATNEIDGFVESETWTPDGFRDDADYYKYKFGNTFRHGHQGI